MPPADKCRAWHITREILHTAESVRARSGLIAWDIASRNPGSVCGPPSTAAEGHALLRTIVPVDMRRFRASCWLPALDLESAAACGSVITMRTRNCRLRRVAANSEDHYPVSGCLASPVTLAGPG
jgi:hypothetical protein